MQPQLILIDNIEKTIKVCRNNLHTYNSTRYRQCPECLAAKKNRHYVKNKARDNIKRKAWQQANLVKCSGYNKKSRAKHPGADKETRKRYRQNNKAKVVSWTRKHQLAKLKRTPKWLTLLHFQQIQIFYEAAAELTKEFEIPMEVDHIVPLQGKNVSGLHVPWNLQVITQLDNRKKINKW